MKNKENCGNSNKISPILSEHKMTKKNNKLAYKKHISKCLRSYHKDPLFLMKS